MDRTKPSMEDTEANISLVQAPIPSSDLFSLLDRSDQPRMQDISRPTITYWQDAWLRIRKNRLALVSACYVLMLALAALIVPSQLYYSYDEQEVWNAHVGPSLGQLAVVVSQDGLDFDPAIDPNWGSGASEDAIDILNTPSGLELVGQALTSGVVLRWKPVSGAEGYRLYRSIDEDTLGLPLEDVEAEFLSYLDEQSLQANTRYYYRVMAFSYLGESEVSSAVEVTPLLSLRLADAQIIEPNAKIGQTIKTPPHYLGTDYLGRDMLARAMMGARISLFIGLVAPLIYIFIGVLYGSISGYFGGIIDDLMMRFADMVSTVPELLTVIMLQVFLGSGVGTLIIALVMSAWARSARQIRGEALKIREMEFVQAAKILGTPLSKIIVRHLLPNVTGTVLVLFTLAIPQAIFTEAFLSFIGLGIAPPLASWGTVTREGAKVFLTYPHELLVPAILICVSIFAFNILGDGLRDALDPKLRGVK